VRLRLHSAGSTLPHLWPTGSSSGLPPSITARYFSSCPSDSTSRWTPCPPENRRLVASGSPWLVSGFRFRARLGFSIPSTFSGPRGITPAFGYSAPHSSARGTSTLLNNALPSAHYASADLPPFRMPRQAFLHVPEIGCGYTSVQLVTTSPNTVHFTFLIRTEIFRHRVCWRLRGRSL